MLDQRVAHCQQLIRARPFREGGGSVIFYLGGGAAVILNFSKAVTYNNIMLIYLSL